MAIYQCKCISCEHVFYSIEIDCKEVDLLKCPLCQKGVEVEDIKKPVDRDWGKCGKSKCGNNKKD